MKKLTKLVEYDSKALTEKICDFILDRKGEDVISINVQGKTGVADYFVVASGRSMTHTRSLTEYVVEEAEKIGYSPIRAEGVKEGRWAVLDFGDVIVHVFNDETRLMYHLETLWGDNENVKKY